MSNPRLTLVAAILAAGLVLPSPAICSKFEQSITVGAGEEYNTNVNEKADAKPEWTSVVSAKGTASFESARIKASGVVDGTYNFYALGNRQDEIKGNGSAKATVAVVQELLFLEGEEQFRQVYTNLARGETDPTDSTRQQTNQNIATARAYITPRLGDRLQLKTGGEFKAYIYDSSVENRQLYTVFANGSYELTPTFQLTIDLSAQRKYSVSGDEDRLNSRFGFKWNYSDDGTISISAGPRYNRYNDGDTVIDADFDASWTQKYKRWALTAAASSKYVDNPSTTYSSRSNNATGSLAWTGERSTITASCGFTKLTGEDTNASDQLSLQIAATYKLTERLSLSASGSRQFSISSSSSQTRWYASGSLNYDLGRDFSMEGYYKWKLSDSSRGGENSYNVNIAGLQLKKSF